MNAFNYRDGALFGGRGGVVRHRPTLRHADLRLFRAHIEAQLPFLCGCLQGMPHLVCFAVKSQPISVFECPGAPWPVLTSSPWRAERVLAAGGDANKIVFSGVGKSRDDMRVAPLEVGVLLSSTSSPPTSWSACSSGPLNWARQRRSRCGFNPDVDAGTHPYISTGLEREQIWYRHQRCAGRLRPRRSAAEPGRWSASIAISACN